MFVHGRVSVLGIAVCSCVMYVCSVYLREGEKEGEGGCVFERKRPTAALTTGLLP